MIGRIELDQSLRHQSPSCPSPDSSRPNSQFLVARCKNYSSGCAWAAFGDLWVRDTQTSDNYGERQYFSHEGGCPGRSMLNSSGKFRHTHHRDMWRIVHNRKFRLLWLAILINEVGVIAYFTVSGWLALTLTDSPFWVGATAGMSGLALATAILFAGVIVDRLDKRKLLITGHMVQMVFSFTIAILIFTEQIALWHILVMAFVRGLVASVRITATHTLILDVVGRSRLLTANGATFVAYTIIGISIPSGGRPGGGTIEYRMDLCGNGMRRKCGDFAVGFSPQHGAQ